MAQDNSAGLSTMLAFLGQGAQGQGQQQQLPQQQSGIPQVQQMQMPNMSLPQQSSGGALSSILGNLASSYLSHKLSKHIEKVDAQETADAYGPLMDKLKDSATDSRHKEAYTTIAGLVKSGNPMLSSFGMGMHKKIMEQDDTLTNEQRNFADPELRPYVEQKMQNEGIPTDIRAMSFAYPHLKPGSPEYADQLNAYRKSGAMNMGDDGMPAPPINYMWNKEKTGVTPIPGGPGDKRVQPLTEFEGKASSFSKRMSDAHSILIENEGLIDVPQLSEKQWAEKLPMVGPMAGAILNQGLTARQQKVDQAQRAFINGLLRHDSGATITPEEFDNYAKEFFPSVGDKPETIVQKRARRAAAIQNMDTEAGAGGDNWNTKVPQEGGYLPGTKKSKPFTVPAKDEPHTLEEYEAEMRLRGLMK